MQNKYLYLYVVQGDYGYGHGWEDECASENYKEARSDLLSYLENGTGRYRLIKRREPTSNYSE
mgnify:CR=1 FL=1